MKMHNMEEGKQSCRKYFLNCIETDGDWNEEPSKLIAIKREKIYICITRKQNFLHNTKEDASWAYSYYDLCYVEEKH